MNQYDLFFLTSIHAHFVALLVALYRLYETRSDSFNIPSLLKRLRLDGELPSAIVDQLDHIHDEARPVWVKVNVLRNKVFGHRSTAHTIDEVFREAGASPNDLGRLIESTRDLLNRLAPLSNNDADELILGSKESVRNLLDDLARLHSRDIG